MKNSEKLRDQAALWQTRATNAFEEAQREGAAKAERFNKKADQLLAFADAAEKAEAAAVAGQEAKQHDAVEAAARRAINDWSAPRIRGRMQEVRKLQTALMKDYEHTEPRVRALDRLFNELRVRAEGIERAEIERKVYAEWSGAEAERRIESLWEEHRRCI